MHLLKGILSEVGADEVGAVGEEELGVGLVDEALEGRFLDLGVDLGELTLVVEELEEQGLEGLLRRHLFCGILLSRNLGKHI